jgi:DNA polymerase zeta
VSLCLSDDGTAGGALTELSFVLDPPDAASAAPLRHCVPGRVAVHSLPNEAALLHALVAAVRAYDPDIILGFDVHAGSLGYLAERCDFLGGEHAKLYAALSRTPGHEPPGALRDDEYGRNHGAGIWVTGRAVLNLWRILRGEVKLGSYTYEAAMMAVLRRRVPAVPRRALREWYAAARSRWRVVADVASRARGVMRMCPQLDLVGRTSELARVFGIDFNSVLIRGSQYRVESMMLRLAHSQNFLALSPDKKAIAGSKAPEFIALVRAGHCVCRIILCTRSLHL